MCSLARELLAGQVSIRDLVHHHQSREEGQQEEAPPGRPFHRGLEPVGEHGRHHGHRGQQVDHQPTGGVVQLQLEPQGRGGQTQQFREDQADSASGLENGGSHGADAQPTVPADQVGKLGHALAGQHEAQASGCSDQDQRLTAPVETDFTLPGFYTKGESFRREEEDAFSQTQAVLQQRRQKAAEFTCKRFLGLNHFVRIIYLIVII